MMHDGMPAASASDAKAKLLEFLEDEVVAQEVMRPEGKPTRGRIDEMILELERLNTEDEPVYSEKLDGTWKVKYSGSYAPGMFASPTRELALFLYSGGYSLGNALSSFADGFWGQAIGVKVLSKKVRIQGGRDVDAEAEIQVGDKKSKLEYAGELMPLSPRRMNEEILSVQLPDPIGKQDLPLELRRSMLVTYLDEDTLVVRDESGVAEVLIKELAETVPKEPVKAEAEPVSPELEPPVAPEEDVEEPDSKEEALASEASNSTAPKKGLLRRIKKSFAKKEAENTGDWDIVDDPTDSA